METTRRTMMQRTDVEPKPYTLVFEDFFFSMLNTTLQRRESKEAQKWTGQELQASDKSV